MHPIKDKEWAPEYPIVEQKTGIFTRGKKDYIVDYPITKRTCRMCKKSFLRKELPPQFNKTMDALLGKDICVDCAYKWIQLVYEYLPIMLNTDGRDVRKALDEEFILTKK